METKLFHLSDDREGGLDDTDDCCGHCDKTNGEEAFPLPPLVVCPNPFRRNATLFVSSLTKGVRSFIAISKTSQTHCRPRSGNIFRVARVAVSLAHILAVKDVILLLHSASLAARTSE